MSEFKEATLRYFKNLKTKTPESPGNIIIGRDVWMNLSVAYEKLEQQNAQLAAHNRVLVEAIKDALPYIDEAVSRSGWDVLENEAWKNCQEALNQPPSLRAQREQAVLEAAKHPDLKEWLNNFEAVFNMKPKNYAAVKEFLEAVEALEQC